MPLYVPSGKPRVLNRHWIKQTSGTLSDESALTGFDGHFLGRRNSLSVMTLTDKCTRKLAGWDKTRRHWECEYTYSNWLNLQAQKNIGGLYCLVLFVFQVAMISIHVVGALHFIVLYSSVVLSQGLRKFRCFKSLLVQLLSLIFIARTPQMLFLNFCTWWTQTVSLPFFFFFILAITFNKESGKLMAGA